MRPVAAVLCVCAGCGRLGFDDRPGTGATDAAGDAGPVATQLVNALACETDVVLRAVPRVDELHWLDAGGAVEAIVAIHHVDNAHHEVHVYPLSVVNGAVVAPIDAVPYRTSDMFGAAVGPLGTGYVVALTDLGDSTLHVLQLDASFAMTANHPVAGFAFATVPAARSTAGLRAIGLTGTGVAMVGFDATLSPSFGPVTIDAGSDNEPSIAPIGADFLVAWDAPNAMCAFARVTIDGTIVAGPVMVQPPGASSCTRPYATAVGGGAGAVLAMHDTTNTAQPIA